MPKHIVERVAAEPPRARGDERAYTPRARTRGIDASLRADDPPARAGRRARARPHRSGEPEPRRNASAYDLRHVSGQDSSQTSCRTARRPPTPLAQAPDAGMSLLGT